MTDKILRYKNYQGSVEVELDEEFLHGKILFINDLVTYRAETPAALRKEFEAAVDDYLAFCAEEGVEPDKPFSGTVQIRLGENCHREVAVEAAAEGESLNHWIVGAIHGRLEQAKRARSFRSSPHTQTIRLVYEAVLRANESQIASAIEPTEASVFKKLSTWKTETPSSNRQH